MEWLFKSYLWASANWKVWGIPSILTSIGLFLKWSYGMRESRAKAKKAEIEAQTANISHSMKLNEWNNMQREEKIREYYKQIEKAEQMASRGRPRPVYFEEVSPAEGEDPELVQEAFERYKRNR